MVEVEDAIYDALYANASIKAAVGTNIYRGPAAKGAGYPLITYGFSGGGNVNDTPIDMLDLTYLVQGVSLVSSAEAETLAGYVFTALNRATLTITGWTNFSTTVGPHIAPVELMENGRLTYRAGRNVRIRASK